MKENKNQKENLPDILGFYFLIFQKSLSGDFIKCWLDGSEDWVFYSKKELIDFVSLSKNLDLVLKMKSTFNDTGIFLWDVENNFIKRLHASGPAERGIMSTVLSTAKELKEPSFLNNFNDFYKIEKNSIEIKK